MRLRDKLFSFEGRLRRRDWWLLSLALAVVQALAGELSMLVLYGPSSTLLAWVYGKTVSSHPTAAVLVSVAVATATLWPGLALITKRRHDRNASGVPFIALQIAFMVIAYGLQAVIIAGAHVGRMVMLAASLTGVALELWLIIGLGVPEGTPGPNRYGSSPKGHEDPVGVFD